MVVQPTRDRRAERREATRAEILEAALDLANEHGLAGLSLRDVAARVGMRPPSLYWYFDSKHAIYDALFAQGNQRLLERIDETSWPEEPRELLRVGATMFIEFATEDSARAQLMFQRTIPDFEPLPESYALAVEVFERTKVVLTTAGIVDPAHVDLWTALVSGLANQQIANDPGGDRWTRLIVDAVDMYANHVLTAERKPR